jgi:hypothetical protein
MATPSKPLAVAGAAVLSVATLWTVLIDARVSVPDPPEWVRGTDFGEFLEAWYAWQSGTLGQERWALLLLCVGLVGVAGAAVRVAQRGGTATTSAAAGIAGGAALWACVGLAQSGARHAVEQMAASGNQIDAVNSIAFTVDTTAGWMHAGACAILGLGLAVLAAGNGPRSWRIICAAAAVAALAFALLLLAESDAAKYAGLVLGAALLPVWSAAAWWRPEPGDTATRVGHASAAGQRGSAAAAVGS